MGLVPNQTHREPCLSSDARDVRDAGCPPQQLSSKYFQPRQAWCPKAFRNHV